MRSRLSEPALALWCRQSRFRTSNMAGLVMGIQAVRSAKVGGRPSFCQGLKAQSAESFAEALASLASFVAIKTRSKSSRRLARTNKPVELPQRPKKPERAPAK